MIPIGTVIDRYVVEAELGAGGVGVVVRARHQFTGAVRAVKMLNASYALDADTQARFEAEARAPNAINHRGIVQVIDAGRTATGALFLVMELLEGQPLRAAMLQRRLGIAAIRRIVAELCDALAAAHAHGFVHRDLKPENVFLCTPDDTVKLLDFGIAKVLGAAITTAPRTAAGTLMGTLVYMAPEQVVDASRVDTRADLWAVGVMLYEMVAWRLPYPQQTIAELYVALQRDEPMPIQAFVPGATPEVIAFFARALARDPARRFQTAQELATAFAALTTLTTPDAVARPAAPNSSALATGPTMESNRVMPTMATQGAAVAGPVGSQLNAATAPSTVEPPPPVLAPMPMPAPPPPSPPVVPAGVAAPRAPRSRTAVAIGLGVLALGMIVTAIAIATREHHKDGDDRATPVADDHPAKVVKSPLDDDGKEVPIDHWAPPQEPSEEAPADAAAPPPPRQKQPANPPPAPPPPQPAPPQPPPQPHQLTRDEFCGNVCSLAAKCGLAGTNCLQTCTFNPQTVECVSHVASSPVGACNELAACAISNICGSAPSGQASCSQAMACQFQTCPVNNVPCGCQCARAMARSHAQLLLGLDNCVVPCFGNAACVQQRCSGLVNACSAQ